MVEDLISPGVAFQRMLSMWSKNAGTTITQSIAASLFDRDAADLSHKVVEAPVLVVTFNGAAGSETRLDASSANECHCLICNKCMRAS